MTPPTPPTVDRSAELLIDAAWRVEQLAEAEPLTDRELDVLGLVVAGATTPEAAQALGLSVSTVKGYLGGLYAKTGLRSREAVLRHAFELPVWTGRTVTANLPGPEVLREAVLRLVAP